MTAAVPNANDAMHVRMVNTQIGRTVVALGLEPDILKIVPEEAVNYPVTPRDEQIIASARRHLVDARALPMPVIEDGDINIYSRWKNWRESLFLDTEGLGSCEEILHFAQARVPFDAREPWNDSFAHLHNLVINEFPWIRDDANPFRLGDNRHFCDIFYERGVPDRKFSEWTVLKGEYLNRQTYLAGLELLRQDFTSKNSELFITTIMATQHAFRLTKEMVYICRLLHTAGVPTFDALIERVLKTKAKMTL